MILKDFSKKSQMLKIVQFEKLSGYKRFSSTLIKFRLLQGGQRPDLENFSTKNFSKKFFLKNAQNASIRVKNMFLHFSKKIDK